MPQTSDTEYSIRFALRRDFTFGVRFANTARNMDPNKHANNSSAVEPADVSSWLRESSSALDILYVDADELPEEFYVLDQDERDRLFRTAFSKKVGSWPTSRATSLTISTTKRVAWNLARRVEPNVSVDSKAMAASLFYPLKSELMTLIPVRHLVRTLASKLRSRTVVIPIPQAHFTVVGGWSDNALEPIYFALELRRRGIAVALLLDPENARTAPQALSFSLSKTWVHRQRPSFWFSKGYSHVLSKATMRRPSVPMETHAIKQRRRSGWSPFRFLNGGRKIAWPNPIEVPLSSGAKIGAFPVLSVENSKPNLGCAFACLFSKVIDHYAKWLRRELRGRAVQTAHIADHATIESCLLAYEAKRRGGKVHIWPHSSNPVHTLLHDPKDVTSVTMAVRTTAEVWAKRFGHEKIQVNPEAILPATNKAPSFDDRFPLHVVIFSGSYALQRTPHMDYQAHEASWRETLRAIQATGAKLSIKARPVWETQDWIRALAPSQCSLQFETTHANKLMAPNMMFMSISLATTALFEGMARGIPGFIVRDTPVNDTLWTDAGGFPCLRSNEVASFVASMDTKEAWTDLRDRQKEWFYEQTKPYSWS